MMNFIGNPSVYILLLVILIGCFNPSSNFKEIVGLNELVKNYIEHSECCGANDDVLQSLNNEQAPIKLKAKELSIIEARFYYSKKNDSYYLAYNRPYSFIKDTHYLYVYVNNPGHLEEYSFYESFRDGLIKYEYINENWFLCKMTYDL